MASIRKTKAFFALLTVSLLGLPAPGAPAQPAEETADDLPPFPYVHEVADELAAEIDSTPVEDKHIELSLQELFQQIERTNLELLRNKAVLEQALQRIYAQRAGYLPKVALEVTQLRTQYVNTGRGFGDLPAVPPASRFDAKVVVSQPIIDPTAYANWRDAIFNYEVAEMEQQTVLQEILASAAAAYFAHLRNIRLGEVIRQNIARDERVVELAESQFQAGQTTAVDISRANLQQKRDEMMMAQQETLVKESSLQIKELIEIDLDTDLALEDPELARQLAAMQAAPPGIEALLESRSDYQLLVRQLRKRHTSLTAAKAQRLPTVAVFGEAGYASEEAFDSEEEEAWAAGVSLSLPIFESGRINANIRQALAAIRETEYAMRDLERRIGSQYRLALQELESRHLQLEIAREQVSLSEAQIEQAMARFEQGEADYREVLDAQADLTDSSETLVDARYFYNLARLNLAEVRGDVHLLLNPL